MATVILTRRETFSASHRLHSAEFSAQQNQSVYGKCNREHGHGHNYVVEVSIRGKVDPTTGMVMNLVELKDHMRKAIIEPLDHSNIDLEIAEFKQGLVSTAENIVVWIWAAMKRSLPRPELLFEIKLHETENNSVTYRGE